MADETHAPPGDAPAPAPARPAPTHAAPASHAATPAAPAVPSQFLAELDRARAEREAARAELAKRDAAEAETKALLAQLQEKVALTEREREALAAARTADRIRYEARMAAAEHGAVDPDDVVDLVTRGLKVDADRVVAADGTPVADFVKGYLAKKPHLARARVAGGSGASPFPPAGGAGAPAPPDLGTAEGMTAYARRLTHGSAPTAPPTTPGSAGGPGRGH
jgi:hypothetical protein